MVEAAIELADRDGIKSISMRRLAQELGVEAMSLYTHVRNKDDLLDGGEQQADQDRDDGDDHEQFDQREAARAVTRKVAHG